MSFTCCIEVEPKEVWIEKANNKNLNSTFTLEDRNLLVVGVSVKDPIGAGVISRSPVNIVGFKFLPTSSMLLEASVTMTCTKCKYIAFNIINTGQ